MNNNEFISMFEYELSKFTGAPYVVLVDSCTNALFLTIKYLQKISYNNMSNMDILIPKNTYVSVPQAIIHSGCTPIYSNIEWKGSYQLGNFPVYDCAVNFKPNMYKNKTFMCLSFQQKKCLNIGKGGAILLDNKKAYNTLKRMSFDGRDASISVAEDLYNITLGYHMNMTPDDASKGLLILNQLNTKDINRKLGSFKDYPDISHINYN